jgi:hypothetical protein
MVCASGFSVAVKNEHNKTPFFISVLLIAASNGKVQKV